MYRGLSTLYGKASMPLTSSQLHSILIWFYAAAWWELAVIVLTVAWLVQSIGFVPHEPRLRIVQWAYPGASAATRKAEAKRSWAATFSHYFVVRPLVWIDATDYVEDFYVKSLSEYAGARGTTANKVMLVVSTMCGCIQIFLAIGLYITELSDTSRTWITITGGFACIVLGFAESAWVWNDTALTRQESVSKDLVYRRSVSAGRPSPPPALNRSRSIVPPNYSDAESDDLVELGRPKAHDQQGRRAASGSSKSPLPIREDDPVDQNNAAENTHDNSHDHVINPNANSKDSVQVAVSDADMRSDEPQVEGAAEVRRKSPVQPNGVGHSVDLSPIEPDSARHDANTLAPPDHSNVRLRLDANVTGQHTELTDDVEEKKRRMLVHTVSVLILLHCNFTVEVIAQSGSLVSPVATGLAIAGLAIFWIFAQVMWVSGNYDDTIPRFIRTKHFFPAAMFRMFYCPQNRKAWYKQNVLYKWNGAEVPSVSTMGRWCLAIEALPLVLLIGSIPVEMIARWHTMF